ncbi:MAG TPA: hypothetical protein VFF94_13105, partial [Novosphingobium sp.]|nr:hypothetical protein [Novosphingobium sp.]
MERASIAKRGIATHYQYASLPEESPEGDMGMIKSGQTSGNRQRKRHAHRLIAAAWAMPATSMPAAAVALLAAPAAQAQDAARSFDIP